MESVIGEGMVENKSREYKIALSDGIPIMIGFIPIGMTFGILSKEVGLSFISCMLFSLAVFAGASQFIAISLIQMGAGIGEIVLTTMLLNFRHFLMSASLGAKLGDSIKGIRPLVAFGIVDEIFSLASFKDGGVTKEYLVTLQIIGYISWNIGTGLGFVLGGILPTILRASMGIGLYAMFAAILAPKIKQSHRALILALMAGAINSLLILILNIPQGWSIVITIIIVASYGSLCFKGDDEIE